jgi:hypothetical protein
MKWIMFRKIVMKNSIIVTRGIIAGMVILIPGILKYFLAPALRYNTKLKYKVDLVRQ